jgi:hypothetical protein
MAGIKNPLGNPTPGVRARVGSHTRSLPRPSIFFQIFFRPRPSPGCSYLEPAMERDRGAQRVNSFNHCCYARVRHGSEGTRRLGVCQPGRRLLAMLALFSEPG